jgi:DNA-binding response OmpR family regulator
MVCDRRPASEPKAETARVLTTKDEAMIAPALSDLLEAEGYEVILASDDGAEA